MMEQDAVELCGSWHERGSDRGTKHPFGLLEGATENAAVVQAPLRK